MLSSFFHFLSQAQDPFWESQLLFICILSSLSTTFIPGIYWTQYKQHEHYILLHHVAHTTNPTSIHPRTLHTNLPATSSEVDTFTSHWIHNISCKQSLMDIIHTLDRLQPGSVIYETTHYTRTVPQLSGEHGEGNESFRFVQEPYDFNAYHVNDVIWLSPDDETVYGRFRSINTLYTAVYGAVHGVKNVRSTFFPFFAF